jgi:hypothetical protein
MQGRSRGAFRQDDWSLGDEPNADCGVNSDACPNRRLPSGKAAVKREAGRVHHRGCAYLQ